MNDQQSGGLSQIIDRIKILEKRISYLEKKLDIIPEQEAEETPAPSVKPKSKRENLEYDIGQFWFAKAGIVILALGLIFLLTLPYDGLAPVAPSLIGYAIVGLILFFSYLSHRSFELIAKYLVGTGMVIFYFSTLRLHYFGAEPAIAESALIAVLLSAVVIINLTVSIRRNSIYLAGISMLLGYITAILNGSSYFIFGVLTVLALLTIYLKFQKNWNGLVFPVIMLTYFTHLTWLINNPFLGNKIGIVSEPFVHLIFLFLYLIIFAAGNFFQEKDETENFSIIGATFLNTLGFSGIYLLAVFSTFTSEKPLLLLIASLVMIAVSIFFWARHQSRYSTFFFAILGYMMLSGAIISQFNMPDYFVVLCWQSILVITTAIWFRSKFIIFANFVIYLIMYIAFLIAATEVSIISVSFGIVALLSARILNWKKDRLELKTELMRNSYLVSAFLIIPYALYHSMNEGYVAVSWGVVALFYYFLSFILKNKKYRWMGNATLLLTVIYIVIIGTIQFDPVYRIISYLVVGILLLIVSLVYTKLRSKMISRDAEDN